MTGPAGLDDVELTAVLRASADELRSAAASVGNLLEVTPRQLHDLQVQAYVAVGLMRAAAEMIAPPAPATEPSEPVLSLVRA